MSSFHAPAKVEFAQVAVVGASLWESIGLAGVLVVLAVIGTADAITNPSLSSLVPDLVRSDQVRPVVGLMDSTQQFTWVLGPGSAAVLLVWMPAEQLFLLDAATIGLPIWITSRLNGGSALLAAYAFTDQVWQVSVVAALASVLTRSTPSS